MSLSALKSARISQTSIIVLRAPLKRVFPLFGPIREMEWAAGWEPQVLYATADLEERMVFKVQSHHGQEPDSTWTVSKYSPDQAFIEYTVFTPERIWWITIECKAGKTGETTEAKITYTYTGLTERGNAINAKALQMMYRHDLKDWETALNHYLETSKRLEHH
jgi:hypothetical protein